MVGDNNLRSLLEGRLVDLEEFRMSGKSEQSIDIFCTVSSIAADAGYDAYLTPIRHFGEVCVFGVVVSSQKQISMVIEVFRHLVTGFIFDAEKKLDAQYSGGFVGNSVAKPLELEYGNLNGYARRYVRPEQFFEFKANDTTADSIWYFLTQKYPGLIAGKKIAVLGAGNLGLKVGLKVLESGATVRLYRRDFNKGVAAANFMNILKPRGTLANASAVSRPLEAIIDCDIVICCGPVGTVLIDKFLAAAIKHDALVLDVGRGNLSPEAIADLRTKRVKIFRGDVTAGLIGLVESIRVQSQVFNKMMGTRSITSELTVGSGGELFEDGVFVVDDYASPRVIFGVADGAGRFREPTDTEKKVIERFYQRVREQKI